MKKKIELLAPGGDIDSIKAAIIAGADAIYCGLDKFNARNRAENITLNDLNGIIRLAHKNNCEVFLTLNIIILESEFPALIALLNKLVNSNIDGVIVQDFGLFYILSKYYSTLKIHASTQLTTHNEGQIKVLSQLAASRVNLSRELNLDEIKDLSTIAHKNNLLTEVFVHGSNCISFSGQCYMSSVNGGNSGNRGRCSQPCRDQYLTTAEGKNFPLNIKDNSAFSDLRELYDAGVDSVKIEGRIKKYHYVYTVVSTWRKHLQNFYDKDKINNDDSDLRKVFNRDFSNSFLKGDINKNVFIDNPRDNSAIYLSTKISKYIPDHNSDISSQNRHDSTNENLAQAKRELYDVKTEIISDVKNRIAQLSIEKAPLIIRISGQSGVPLKVSVQTPDTSFIVFSNSKLVNTSTSSSHNPLNKKTKKASSQNLDSELILTRFKAINDSEYFIDCLDLDNLHQNLFIPFKELTSIKKKILFILNDSKETLESIDFSLIKKQSYVKPKLAQKAATLSLLISTPEDLHLCDETSAEIYYELPNSFKNNCSKFIDLFKTNKKLIPWFPSVLIGENYHAAVEFLQQVQPKHIVTNNTGIAFEAYQKEIPWIAGPYLNIVNSFGLLCLKENFNCSGAFISNEINRNQIRRINKPTDFKLYYSIYHPIVLMTSKVCFFHQVTGCKKNIVDNTCIQRCEKSSFITNLKEVSFFIKKTKNNYHSIYNESNFLNTEIVTDFPDLFSHLFIDLRSIKTETKIAKNKSTMVKLFEYHLSGDHNSAEKLKQSIQSTTQTQYKKGI
ncbi:MAG: peptidase U32 family protein [Pseudomonadota bacterium]